MQLYAGVRFYRSPRCLRSSGDGKERRKEARDEDRWKNIGKEGWISIVGYLMIERLRSVTHAEVQISPAVSVSALL
jgi:hypothetical protein